MKKTLMILLAIVLITSCMYKEIDKNKVCSEDITVSSEDITVNGVTFTMITVKGGVFKMGDTFGEGDSEEKPIHNVTLCDYMIGETEVTQELWTAVMGSNPSYFAFMWPNLPVERVDWNDCQEFITKLNTITGKQFRLPTEAEWEYAARGGNKSKGYKYSGSNNLGRVAWSESNSSIAWHTTKSSNKTHTVKTKMSNELGIYDMSGNVSEWCSDLRGDYSRSAQANPTGATSGLFRVLRGGNYYGLSSYCRVSARSRAASEYIDYSGGCGLRLVLVP